MTKVFVFEDYHKHSCDPLEKQIIKVDINKEITVLEEEGWIIKSIQHQIIHDYYEYYERWDKDIFTVIADKENKDE